MRAVIFDLGHTLIDYHNDWREPERRSVAKVAEMVCRERADGLGPEAVQTYLTSLLDNGRMRRRVEQVEVPLIDVVADCLHRFGLEGNEDLVQEGLEAFYGVLLEARRIVPGTVEMLEDVRDRGYRIGLVSDVAWGLPSYFPLRDMKYYGLDDFFDDMVFSTDVLLRKPNPRIFKIALSNLGAKAEESMYVGNNVRLDIKGALGVGMKAILKESEYREDEDNVHPTQTVSVWNDFRFYLDRLRDLEGSDQRA